ncbi:YheC/YheD family endospore coat-associated protein [Neobacillus sp. Marseille-QA0830]
MNAASPLIGIMTARNTKGAIAGNLQLFTALQKELITHNGSSYIFAIDGVERESITGYSYSFSKGKWLKGKFPYPNLVYNRIPFRKTEQDQASQQFFDSLKERNIPFFNPCFIDKLELYQVLGNHPILKKHLPATILVNDKTDLWLFLNRHSQIYLKPAKSSKGRGIYRLGYCTDHQIKLEGIHESFTYPSFEPFWDDWSELLIKKHYIAQQDIQSAEFQGYRYDFRILAHAGQSGYELTGIGIRQSQKQDITTHIPAGGRLLPYERLQSNTHDQFVQSILPAVGAALTERYGFFGEFTIDAGLSQSGQYFIYEVNSKPMTFDELEIEEKKINRLCQLFLQLAVKDAT